MSEVDLLDTGSVAGYLRDRGVLARPPQTVLQVAGGVSNVVLLVVSESRRVIVKQALPRLRVAEDWPAKRERTLTEAAALSLASRLTPGAVPAVLDVDPRLCALTIEAAPEAWEPWKSALLRGEADSDIAGRMGSLLGTWHHATIGMEVPDDPVAFVQLRLSPYYHTAASRHPALAQQIKAAADELAATRHCLVHGDYSPKNILTSGRAEELWVIDWEVAHRGHPVFDVAFLLSHLVLKAFHRPSAAQDLSRAAQRFLGDYRACHGPGADDDRALALQLGCLLLARVDGKSPVEYLHAASAPAVRSLAAELIRNGFEGAGGALDAIFQRIGATQALTQPQESQQA